MESAVREQGAFGRKASQLGLSCQAEILLSDHSSSLKTVLLRDRQACFFRFFQLAQERHKKTQNLYLSGYAGEKRACKNGARYRVRTCDPYRVKVVLYR